MRDMKGAGCDPTGRKKDVRCNLAVGVGHLGKELASVTMTVWRNHTYLQDPTREVMVIIDAAVALATLGHEVTVEP